MAEKDIIDLVAKAFSGEDRASENSRKQAVAAINALREYPGPGVLVIKHGDGSEPTAVQGEAPRRILRSLLDTALKYPIFDENGLLGRRTLS